MIVLDASAVLVALQREDGLERVGGLLETQSCSISIVNYSEVHEKLLAAGSTHREARDMFDALEVRVLPFRRVEADVTAALRLRTGASGIGIADRACIATGLIHDAAIFTADHDWDRVDVPEADIQFVR